MLTLFQNLVVSWGVVFIGLQLVALPFLVLVWFALSGRFSMQAFTDLCLNRPRLVVFSLLYPFGLALAGWGLSEFMAANRRPPPPDLPSRISLTLAELTPAGLVCLGVFGALLYWSRAAPDTTPRWVQAYFAAIERLFRPRDPALDYGPQLRRFVATGILFELIVGAAIVVLLALHPELASRYW